MEITVDNRELVALERRLALAGKATPQNIGRVLKTIGVIVKGKAVAYAPRSQTKSEYVATLAGGKTKRATSSFHPGQLKRSITTEVFPERVEIGVPSNSPAKDYAEKIHETWKRTPHNDAQATDHYIHETWKRTPHNDAQATDHYIFKAQEDSEADYMRAVDALVDKIIKAI